MSLDFALLGFDGVRAYSADPPSSQQLLSETLGFTRQAGETWEVRGERRGSVYAYDRAPPELGRRQGAGSVHHVAFAARMEEIEQWRERIAKAGARPTPVIERFYFKSVYFLEPSGVLFEIATLGPGFTVDEPLESLGEKLSLPPDYEHLREQVEPVLRPITNPRVPA